MNKAKKKDIASAIVLILFAIAFYGFSFQIQATTSDVLGSRFFPRAGSVILVILALIQIVQALASKEELSEEKEKKMAQEDALNKPLVLTTIFLFAYYFLCTQIGFVITSILYLLGESFVLMPDEDRKKKGVVLLTILLAVAIPLFLNFVFYNIFHIRLPQGSLF